MRQGRRAKCVRQTFEEWVDQSKLQVVISGPGETSQPRQWPTQPEEVGMEAKETPSLALLMLLETVVQQVVQVIVGDEPMM